MYLKVSLFLLLLGSAFVVDANLVKAKHIFQTTKHEKQPTEGLNKKHEEIVAEVWKSKTNENEQPSFYSPSFDSNITGKVMTTLHEREIYAFQGFRYARADRFQPPTPVDKFWDDDNFDAIHIGLKCPQHAYVGEQPSGDEDCLFLNVYTPYHPDNLTESDDKLPVMFFIHGGAYTTGDASLYLPTRLLDHDVILVTIHYRLGAFGFFTLNSEDAPGNMALYDMVAALQWTQTYINDFGGNEDEVTIFGESAGSASVNYMMLVEPARGMFRAVIAESGSCLDHWAFDEDPSFAAHYNAKENGCDYEDDQELLDCMLKVPTGDLVISQDKLVETDRQSGLMGFRGVAPTIQSFTVSNTSHFEYIVTKRPVEYLLQEDFSMVPFMTGSNKQEGSFVAGLMYKEYILKNNLANNQTYMREQMIQDILESVGIHDDTHGLATSFQRLYCPGIDLANTTASINCVIDILGVVFLKAGSWEVANYHSYFSNQSTYYYSFEFVSEDTMLPWLVGAVPFEGGITHSDELMYIFDFPAVMNGSQIETVDRMTKMWTNFATYLNPTPEDQIDDLTKMGIPIWTPYQFENHSLLVIADKLMNYKEFSDRWTISMDEYIAKQPKPTSPEVCEGTCAEYKDQRDSFMAVMITFIVLTFVAILVAIYFGFKARR